jgi:hypothetical protein
LKRTKEQTVIGSFVVVRTFSAGVHCGTLVESAGTAVTLKDSRRIWRWSGASSLNELSQNGAGKDRTRISEPVPQILLTQAIEVIPCSDKAKKNLSDSRWSQS